MDAETRQECKRLFDITSQLAKRLSELEARLRSRHPTETAADAAVCEAFSHVATAEDLLRRFAKPPQVAP